MFVLDSVLCEKDAIIVHDGINAGAPLLKKICGRKSKVTVTSTSNKLFVIFSSYIIKTAFTGFRANFREGDDFNFFNNSSVCFALMQFQKTDLNIYFSFPQRK